jgi:uncharacterized protein (DUF885 family)
MSFDRRTVLAALGATGALAASSVRALARDGDVNAAAEATLMRVADNLLADSPEGATSLGIDTGARAALKSRLSDVSPAGRARTAAMVARDLHTLQAIDLDRLDDTTRTDVDVTRTAYQLADRGYAFPYGSVAIGGYLNSPYVVCQNNGAFLSVPQLLDASHRVEDRAGADAYLARLHAYAGELRGETERLRHDAALGVIQPDFLLSQTLKQLAIARSGDVADWGLVTSLAKRTESMPGDYRAKAIAICRDEIAPALDGQIAELKRQQPMATHDAGVWKLPQGEAYYAWALEAGTTTTMSPDAVHQMGLDQLADLQAQMGAMLVQAGYTNGSVGERLTALGNDPRYLFSDDDAGRAKIIAILQQSIDAMRAKMPQAFHTLVPGRAEVRRMAPEVEPGAPGAYGGPGSVDGKTPGRLWINLRTTKIWPSFTLPDLAYHEAIPGHIWQGEYTFKQPLIRQLLAFNAYSEGWALYAEQFAGELGGYDAVPLAKLGYLQSLAFRAARLVTDTGLHAKRWSREKAIAFLVSSVGYPEDDATSEVDRYCSWPGQACGYKVGHTTIVNLREKTRKALGQAYDFRGFNDAVVLGGNVPLTVLERNIDRYIKTVST